jgi:protein-tyrosine phosphatase
MPIRHHLKAFWWFLEGRVGGMGRPGYNQCHWFDFSLEEGVVFTWLGKQPLTTMAIDHFWQYIDAYAPKVALFHGLSVVEARHRLHRLRERTTLDTVLTSMNAKAGILQDVCWRDDDTKALLCYTPNMQRLQHEIALLKQHNVSVIISLQEHPFDLPLLAQHFETYHLPVEDVTPPSQAQVYAFAEILCNTLAAGKTVVTHCLAGVGRTTTMLMAAYLVQGYAWPELVAWVQGCNPHFQFKGQQVAFLQTLAADIASGRLPRLPHSQETRLCLSH